MNILSSINASRLAQARTPIANASVLGKEILGKGIGGMIPGQNAAQNLINLSGRQALGAGQLSSLPSASTANANTSGLALNTEAGLNNFLSRIEQVIERAITNAITQLISALTGETPGSDVASSELGGAGMTADVMPTAATAGGLGMGMQNSSPLSPTDSFAVPENCQMGPINIYVGLGGGQALEEAKDPKDSQSSAIGGYLKLAEKFLPKLLKGGKKIFSLAGKAFKAFKKIFG